MRIFNSPPPLVPASLMFFCLKRSVSGLLVHKTTPLKNRRVLSISQPHWRFSGDENSLVSPGLGSRHWAGGLGQPGPQPKPTSPSHNSQLSDIHEFTTCFWIGDWLRITAENDNTSLSYCSFYSFKSKLLLVCLLKSWSLVSVILGTPKSLSNLNCASLLSSLPQPGPQKWGPSGAGGLVLRSGHAQKPRLGLLRRRKTGNS